MHARDIEHRPECFDTEVFVKLEASKQVTAAQYAATLHFQREFTCSMEHLMSQVEVLAAPTAGGTSAPFSNRPDEYNHNASKNTVIFDFTGQPSISVPAGLASNGLPVGLILSGKLFEDQRVLEIAHAVEHALGERSNPTDFQTV